jgi:hypothetical protein
VDSSTEQVLSDRWALLRDSVEVTCWGRCNIDPSVHSLVGVMRVIALPNVPSRSRIFWAKTGNL